MKVAVSEELSAAVPSSVASPLHLFQEILNLLCSQMSQMK